MTRDDSADLAEILAAWVKWDKAIADWSSRRACAHHISDAQGELMNICGRIAHARKLLDDATADVQN